MKIGQDFLVRLTVRMIAITPVMAVEDHFIKIALNAQITLIEIAMETAYVFLDGKPKDVQHGPDYVIIDASTVSDQPIQIVSFVLSMLQMTQVIVVNVMMNGVVHIVNAMLDNVMLTAMDAMDQLIQSVNTVKHTHTKTAAVRESVKKRGDQKLVATRQSHHVEKTVSNVFGTIRFQMAYPSATVVLMAL